MPVDPALRLLDIDIPAQPEALVKLSLLLAEEDVDFKALAGLIETDMALAAAVLKAVNSSLYGLSGRVQSVQQAITYLGTREVAAVTFEMGLRAIFPHSPELAPLWDRAARRGVLMGRMGAALGIDPWAAHSAGLFEECGKAVLFRHAGERYWAMLKAWRSALVRMRVAVGDHAATVSRRRSPLARSEGARARSHTKATRPTAATAISAMSQAGMNRSRQGRASRRAA